jgi:hypothetical protein
MQDSWWQRVLMLPLLVIGFVFSFLMEHSETIILRGWQVWNFIKGLGEWTEAVLQALGRIAVSLFLAVGLFVLYYQIVVELGYPQPQLKPIFELVLRIFDGKVIWVVPLIFGATLGILHLWKLQLDRRRYSEELQERWRKEEEERAQQRQATVTARMPMIIPQARRPNHSD